MQEKQKNDNDYLKRLVFGLDHIPAGLQLFKMLLTRLPGLRQLVK